MKRIASILVLLALTGCATFDGMSFENRLACSVAKDKLYGVSEWGGRIGIASTFSEADRAAVCK